MSKLVLKLGAVLVAGVMVSGVAMAEDKKDAGPSVKETVEFINGLLTCEVRSEREERQLTMITVQKSSISLASTLSLNEEIKRDIFLRGKLDMSSPKTNNIEFNLSNLDTEVDQSSNDVKIRCNVSRGSCISGKTHENHEIKSINASDWTLNFCDADKAQRAAKAMKHLIEISGGKKSLF